MEACVKSFVTSPGLIKVAISMCFSFACHELRLTCKLGTFVWYLESRFATRHAIYDYLPCDAFVFLFGHLLEQKWMKICLHLNEISIRINQYQSMWLKTHVHYHSKALSSAFAPFVHLSSSASFPRLKTVRRWQNALHRRKWVDSRHVKSMSQWT